MLSGQFTSRRTVELIDVDEQQLTEDTPNAIIFQPEVTCLCGSDLPFFDADFEGHKIEYPLPVGFSLHEMVGTVVETNGQRFRAGDRVLAVPEEQRGLSERFVLAEDRAIPLDSRVSDEHAMLAQPFGTVLYALQKLPNMLDKDVAVVGQGPIGQLFNAGLRNMGARHIIGIDPLQSRLEMSPRMGANSVVCTHDLDASATAAAVRRITGGDLPDVVIEAVGHRAQAFNLCIELARHHGRILYFGVPPQVLDGLMWKSCMLKNVTVHTSLHPDFERDFPLAMRWIGEGRVNLMPLITHRFPLADIQQAFDVFRDRVDGAQKVIVNFPSAGM